MNNVSLIGNLTRDPELRHFPSGDAVVNFSLALNDVWKDKDGNKQEKAHFVECKMFGKRAEVISQYCKQGDKLAVTGSLDQENWEDKNGGGKRSKLTVKVMDFDFLTKKGDGGGQRQSSEESPPW